MKKEIYFKEGYVSTLLLNETILVKWQNLSNAKVIYDSCLAQLEEVENRKASLIIIDISTATGTPPLECQEWFASVLFPGYAKSDGFIGLINVMPGKAITKMGADRWKKTAMGSQFGFDVFETNTVEAAYELAAELQSRKASA